MATRKKESIEDDGRAWKQFLEACQGRHALNDQGTLDLWNLALDHRACPCDDKPAKESSRAAFVRRFKQLAPIDPAGRHDQAAAALLNHVMKPGRLPMPGTTRPTTK